MLSRAGLTAPVGSYERGLQYQWSFFAASDSSRR